MTVTTVVCSRWVPVLVLTEKADLDAAIAESLKETPGNILGGQISREEQEISRSVCVLFDNISRSLCASLFQGCHMNFNVQ